MIPNLLTCVAIFLFMMIPGVFLTKKGLVSPTFGRDLSNTILYVAQPAMIIHAFLIDFDTTTAKNAGIVFLIAVAFHLVLFFLAFLFFKKEDPTHRSVLRFSVVFANVGFMGIPLIEFIFNNPIAVIYASMIVVAFNLLAWTIGLYMFTDDKKYISLRSAILNPATISTVIGLILFFCNARSVLPDDGVIMNVVISLKHIVSPLSMVVIGLRLATVLSSVEKNTFHLNLFLSLALRLLAAPVIMFILVFLLSKVGFCNDTIAAVSLISASTPVATMVGMLAETYDGDAVYASVIVSVSTVLSLLTMPLISLLLELL